MGVDSAKKRAKQATYRASSGGQAKIAAYSASPKRRAAEAAYRASPEGRAKRRASQAARRLTPEGRAKQRADNLKYEYGITVEQRDAMYAGQEGRCALCLKPAASKDLVVDHNHNTGRVRGLLHHACNAGLGFFRDCPERLLLAALYLERHP